MTSRWLIRDRQPMRPPVTEFERSDVAPTGNAAELGNLQLELDVLAAQSGCGRCQINFLEA